MTRVTRTRSAPPERQAPSTDDEAWLRMAWNVVNDWGKGDIPLRELVAQGLKKAYEMGRNGERPLRPEPEPEEDEQPRQRVIRRTR